MLAFERMSPAGSGVESVLESDQQDAYFQTRFGPIAGREKVWSAICQYLERHMPVRGAVLDLGAGYCSFINQVRASEKHAVDLFPGFVKFAGSGVRTHVGTSSNLAALQTGHFDVVFTSNMLEHLDRAEVHATLAEVRRILKPGGRFVIIQPNYRYCSREYFDDYTHKFVFTHVSLADLLAAEGFEVRTVIPRFLPLTMKSRLPQWRWAVALYLRMPVRPMAKQMLLVAVRPAGA